MALCFLSFLFPLIGEVQNIQIAPWKYITHTQQSCQETLSILCGTLNTHISFIFTLACTWIEIFISACISLRTHSVGWCCHDKLQQHLLHCKMPENNVSVWTHKLHSFEQLNISEATDGSWQIEHFAQNTLKQSTFTCICSKTESFILAFLWARSGLL